MIACHVLEVATEMYSTGKKRWAGMEFLDLEFYHYKLKMKWGVVLMFLSSTK